jgi:glycosyltransferase involved in cell wall biosynthesis
MTNDQRPTTYDQPLRLAWFSPLPPVRSGIATDSAELLERLDSHFTIDRFVESPAVPAAERVFDAHDFVWKHRLDPYNLVVYQLGNNTHHDYIWAYLTSYPGLVVVHDPKLHHARARQLLQHGRCDDYRREFRFDHPHASPDFVEFAVEGLGGPIYYLWSMLGVVMRTARLVAVHNHRVATELSEAFPDTPIEVIRLGKSAVEIAPGARETTRARLGIGERSVVFAAFGRLTSEKRIGPILRACRAVARDGLDVRLLLVGDASDYPSLQDELAGHGLSDRVHVTGYLPDDAIGGYLAAADACLCLRWPTAQETSASWLHCLAAARPTVVSDLWHLVDIPTLDPRAERSREPGEAVAIRIDLLDEESSLALAMRRLADDSNARAAIGRAGHAYWSANHTREAAVGDYRRIIEDAAARPAPVVTDLPSHFTDDYSGRARAIAEHCGVTPDVLD